MTLTKVIGNAFRSRLRGSANSVAGACAAFAAAEGKAEETTDDEGEEAGAVAIALLVTVADAEVWAGLLALLGPRTRTSRARGGAEAEQLLVDRRPDAILIHLGLPDARKLARHLRAMQAAAGEDPSPVIALGAPGMSAPGLDDPDFDAWLSLPLSRAHWTSTLQRIVAGRPAEDCVWLERSIVDAVPDYADSRLQLVDQIRTALVARRWREASALAHMLGGSPGLHGFAKGVAICRTIQRLDEVEQVPQAELLAALDGLQAMLAQLQVR